MKYWNPETMKLQDCPYVKAEVKAEEKAESEQKVETKKRTRKKEV